MSIVSGPNPALNAQSNGIPNLTVPEGPPSLFIDFVNNSCTTIANGIKTTTANAMSLITFSRSSIASYMSSTGLIQYASSNVPRFDYGTYTGFNGYCKGLLIEETSTNSLTYSSDYTQGAWAKQNTSFTANATISPDGTLTAQKWGSQATGNSLMYRDSTIATGTVGTLSIYLKAAELTYVIVQFAGGGFTPSGKTAFNLLTGTVISGIGLATGSIASVGNGWYRCSVTGTSMSSGSVDNNIYIYPCTITGSAITGDGTSGFYIWGAQVETLPYFTSYIPTTSTTVQRLADGVSMSGTNLTSWFNQTQGTFCFIGSRATPSQSGRFISNQNFTPELLGGSPVQANAFSVAMFDGTNLSSVPSSMIINSTARLAGAYTSTTFYGCSMGGTIGTATKTNTYPLTPATTINIAPQSNVNTTGAGANNMDCTVQNLIYYPAALSNASLQQITS